MIDFEEAEIKALREIPAATWDQWLTVTAECWAPANTCDVCIYGETAACERFAEQCLFCDVFAGDCEACDPMDYQLCKIRDRGKRLDAGIDRLEEAGVFNERRQCGHQ